MPLNFAPGRIYNKPDLLFKFRWRDEGGFLRVYFRPDDVSQRPAVTGNVLNGLHKDPC
jgi:hypothetical protein